MSGWRMTVLVYEYLKNDGTGVRVLRGWWYWCTSDGRIMVLVYELLEDDGTGVRVVRD